MWWSDPGCDAWIDRIDPEEPVGAAPCGHAPLDTSPLCLAVAGMSQEGELRPRHDDDRPRTGCADRITDRRNHLHQSALVGDDALLQFLLPETTTSR